MNHEHSQNEKTMGLKRLVGDPKGGAGSCINIQKLVERGDFSQWDLWKFVVRGTTSFCNNKITIFPVGESVVWNVQMWWNE